MKCNHCGKEFTGSRKTAKYCSDSCRVASNRKSQYEPKTIIAEEDKHPFQNVINETIKKVQVETIDHTIPGLPNAFDDFKNEGGVFIGTPITKDPQTGDKISQANDPLTQAILRTNRPL